MNTKMDINTPKTMSVQE